MPRGKSPTSGLTARKKISLGKRVTSPYPFDLYPEDIKGMHFMGAPGYGKSTFIGHVADEFIEAGEGMLVIDIKGQLAEDIASRTKHPDKLIYISPFDLYKSHHYWGLNPFQFDRSDPQLTQAYVDNVVRTFSRIGMVDETVMAQIQEVLTFTSMLAMGLPAPTMMDVWQLLFDKQMRLRLMDKKRSPQAWDFWDERHRSSPRDMDNYLMNTKRRLRTLMAPTWMNNLLGQPVSTILLPKWLNEGKLVVCNFDQSTLGEISAVVASNILISQVIHEAQRRPKGQTPVWRIAVDEFHECAPANFARMVHSLRKYAVFPIMANQSKEQIEGNKVLWSAAKQCSVRAYLHGTGQEDEEGRDLALYTANIEADAIDHGRGDKLTIKLFPWSQEENQEQLETARRSQILLTAHKDDYPNMWDRLEASGRLSPHGTKDSDARRKSTDNRREDRQAKENPPSPPAPRPHAGGPLPEREDPVDLGGAVGPEPASLADESSAPRPPAAGGPRPPGAGQILRGNRKGRQSPLPDPPERS